MLSIIVCSRNKVLLSKLARNIELTSGGALYELIAIDNSEGQYSIFSAYSKGIKSAIGNIICFMHEDVSIETNGWMQSVESIFDKNVEIGLLGVIGDCAIPKQKPSYVGFELPVMHYQQQYGNRIQLVESNIDFYDKERLCRVVAVDGLWFCIPRNLFVNQVVSFDDSFFHGYSSLCFCRALPLRV